MTGIMPDSFAEMTGIDMPQRGPGADAARQSLSQCVREMMQSYFADLDGHTTSGLYQMVLETVEEPLLAAVLEYTRGNQTKAAEILGINRGTLRKKIHYYGLE